MRSYLKLAQGFIIPQTLVYAAIGILIIAALINWGGTSVIGARKLAQSEQSFQIAEAGIDYYRWHLAHAPADYQDGTGAAGPYIHTFLDKDGVAIGTYSLDIVPPPIGSTIVTVTSTGSVYVDPTVKRKVRVKFAIPSLAKYAIVGNDDMRFGEGTEIFGPVHSNGGIRFDGLSHNVVSSSRTSYDDPDHDDSGAERLEHGVHTHVRPPPLTGTYTTYVAAEVPPPATPATRTDVFEAGRQFPVPAVDFAGFTTDLAVMKTQAQTASGKYLAASGQQGYRILFNTNDTYSVYRVNNLRALPNGCTNVANQTGWGSWSIATAGSAQTLLGTYTNPVNGLIFVEDNVWVSGQINSARITVVAARLPDPVTSRPSITVNDDLSYTNYDGSDVIALIAQGDFNVGLFSQDDLRVDAAIIAQNGRAGRYYYENDCSPNDERSLITLSGMIASNDRYGFAYTDGTGYATRTIIYDGNLLYAPPPSFPLTSNQYSTISWEEVR